MRRILAILGFTLLGTVPALSADFQPVPEPTLYNWTGFYLGVTGGWTFDGNLDIEAKDLPFIKFQQEHDGAVAGGFAAARYQFANGPAVIGVEVTGLKSWVEGEDTFGELLLAPFVLDSHASLDTLFLAEGQLGLAFDRALVYASGGFAMADVDFDTRLKIPGLFSEKVFEASNNVNGVVVGGGIDYAVPDTAFVLGVSFKHIVFNDLGLSDKFTQAGGAYLSEVPCSKECGRSDIKIDTNSNLNVDQILARVSYHF
jgi:outer membrane immunogenic protein